MLDLITTCIIFLTALLAFYLYLTRDHGYWKNRGVPFVPPIPIFGSLYPLIMLKRSPGHFMGDIYNAPEGKGQPFVGFFLFGGEPAILCRDPELIKDVFVKDFNHFRNRNVECQGFDPVGVTNLFVLRDDKWKYLRSKLSPTFTSGKIKQMFVLIKGVGAELLKHIDLKIDAQNSEYVHMESKEVMAKYTTDIISTCAFGIQSNSINDPNSEFREFGKKIFDMTVVRALEVRSFFFMHWMAKTFRFIFLQKESTAFFKRVFWDVINQREQNKIVRNDFIDTLIKLRSESIAQKQAGAIKEDFVFDGDSLVAQPVLFFTAGFETTATTITNTLYEMALHQDMQDRLRAEILQNIKDHEGDLTYDGLFEMKYLDMVLSEVLRKYPPMPFIDRLCSEDYKMPNSDLVIKKGTPVFVSMYNGLHYDEEHFPDPEKFDPERFSEEGKQTRHPFSYVPFGEGPHICIGMRFALMNAKTGVSLILSKFKVEACDETVVPLTMDKRAIILTSEGGLYLKYSRV